MTDLGGRTLGSMIRLEGRTARDLRKRVGKNRPSRVSAVTDTAESAANTTDWTSPIEMRPRTFLPKLKAITITTPTTNANAEYVAASTMWSNAYNFGSRNARANAAAINTLKISLPSM